MRDKYIKPLAIIVVALSLLCSCKKETPVLEDGKAKVRFVNAYLNADPQEFYQDNSKLTNHAIAYGAFSDYFDVNAGRSTFWSNNIVENKATSAIEGVLYGENVYTLFYYENKDSKPAMVGYINQKNTPAIGKFKVRFVNLAVMFNDKPLVIKNVNSLLLDGLGFGVTPTYFELSVGAELRINVKDQAIATAIPPASFQDGKTYLIWFDTVDGITVDYHIVPQD